MFHTESIFGETKLSLLSRDEQRRALERERSRRRLIRLQQAREQAAAQSRRRVRELERLQRIHLGGLENSLVEEVESRKREEVRSLSVEREVAMSELGMEAAAERRSEERRSRLRESAVRGRAKSKERFRAAMVKVRLERGENLRQRLAAKERLERAKGLANNRSR